MIPLFHAQKISRKKKKPPGVPDGFLYALNAQTARSTLPERRQRVHTLTCLTSPFTRARTRWIFGFHLRLVFTWE